MLLSGNLNPPTVIFSLPVLPVPDVPPQAAATMASTPSIATRDKVDRLMLINPSTGRNRPFTGHSWPEACNPAPRPILPLFGIYATLNVAARDDAGTFKSLIP